MKYFTILTLLLLAFTSCEKEKSQAEKDDEIIRNYLSDNNREAEYHSSGMYYTITEEGTGESPDVYSNIEVKYKGYLTDNEVFDQTEGDNTFEYPLNYLISGWQIAIPMLKRGGKGIFYLPSALGYGSQQAGPIPPNSVLIFEIELVDFE